MMTWCCINICNGWSLIWVGFDIDGAMMVPDITDLLACNNKECDDAAM